MYCMYQDREELEDDLYQEEEGDSEASEVNSELEFFLYSQLHYSSNALEVEEEEEEEEKEGRGENTADQGSEMAPDAGKELELPSPDIGKVQQHLKKRKDEEKCDKKRKSDPKRQCSSGSSRFEEVIVIDSSPDVISISEDDTADDEGICSLKCRSFHQLQTSTPAQQSNLKKKSSLSVPVTVNISSSDSDSDESESKSESDSSDSLDSSDSSDSEGLENWMILGQGKQNEDQSISLNLEGGSDSNTDAEDEDGSWLVSDKDKEAQICNKDKGARTVLQRVSNRYYTSKNVNCRNCNKTGHLSKNCPEPKKLSPCFLCGTPGHQTRDCPNRHCNNCGLPGHLYSSCSERAYWHKQCHRCGMKGHFFDVCPEIWRQYHITGKTGPPVMQQGEDNGRSPAFCYNCSRKGHFGHACTRQRMFNGVYATIPFISHYDTVEDINRRQHRLKMKVKELKRNGCFSNTCENPVTPEPPKKKQKLNHHKNNHTHHQTSQNHKPSRSHIYFNNDDDDDLTIPKTNKFSKCKQQQSTSNVKPWKPKRPVPTSRDPSTKLFLDEADDFPRGRGKGRGIVGKKSNKNKMKTKEEPKGGQRDRRPDHLFGEKRKKNQARRVSNKKSAASMYPTDENLFIIKQRKRR